MFFTCFSRYCIAKTAKMPVTPKTIPIIGKNVRAALIIWHTMVTRTTDATMVIETDFLRNPNHRETTPSSPARIEQESRKPRDCRNTLIVSLSEQSGNSDSVRATPHKCNDTHCRIAILWKAIGLPRTFARKSALTQAARQGLSARIRFANANMMLNLAPCFSSPRYRVFRKRSCFLTTPNTCSTFARTEDFACSAFFAAY